MKLLHGFLVDPLLVGQTCKINFSTKNEKIRKLKSLKIFQRTSDCDFHIQCCRQAEMENTGFK